MPYGLTVNSPDTGKSVILDSETRNMTVIDSFTMSDNGGSRSYTQSPLSGGIPSGSNMVFYSYWAGYNNTVGGTTDPNVTLGDRSLSWSSYDRFGNFGRDFPEASGIVMSDLAGSFSYSGEYGISVWGNSIRNMLTTNRPVYVLQAKGSVNAGTNETTTISNAAFNSSTALIFARCTGGNFICVTAKNGNSVSFGRAFDETPRAYSTDVGTASGTIEWAVFDKYTQGAKPTFGIELRRRDGVIGYRSEKSLLVVRGIPNRPYQQSYQSSPGSSQSYSFTSAGGGYCSVEDYNAVPMVMVYPFTYREFTITIIDSSNYEYSEYHSAGYRFNSARQLEIGSGGVTNGVDGFYSSPAWTSSESGSRYTLPYIRRSDYF